MRFNLSKSGKRIAILEPHTGQSGWLVCTKFSINSFEAEDHILFAGVRDDGEVLEPDACKRLFDLPAEAGQPILPTAVMGLEEQIQIQKAETLTLISGRNAKWLDEEIGKLDRWSEDLKFGLEQEIKDLDKEIRETKRQAKLETSLEAKVQVHRKVKELEAVRSNKRRDLFLAQDEVDARKETLISTIESRLQQKSTEEVLFRFRWWVE